MSTQPDILQTLLARFVNYGGAAEGTVLPPRQAGPFRVPFVTLPRLLKTANFVGGTTFTVAWDDVPSYLAKVDHYNVWALNLLQSNAQPIGPFSVKSSPAQVQVTSDQGTPIVMLIQTVLTNGQQSDLASSPAVTGVVGAPVITAADLNLPSIQVSGLTVTNNSPGAGSVGWSACTVIYNGTSYSIAAGNTGVPAASAPMFVTWTVGATSFSAATSYSATPTTFLIATNNGTGTADVCWNKVGNSSITRNNLSFGLIEGLQLQPFASVSINPGVAGTVNILSVANGEGGLLSVGFKIAALGTLVNSELEGCQIYLDVTVDGGTTQSILLIGNDTTYGPYSSGTGQSGAPSFPTQYDKLTGDNFPSQIAGKLIYISGTSYTVASWVNSGTVDLNPSTPPVGSTNWVYYGSSYFDPTARTMAINIQGNGTTVGDFLQFYFGVGYTTSITVAIRVAKPMNQQTYQMTGIVSYATKA